MSETITQVIQTTSNETTTTEPSPVPLSDLLGAGYAAVDNSGSTGGAPLRIAEAFTNSLGVARVSLWNSSCSPPVPLRNVTWRSTGGTSPHTIFEPHNHVGRNTLHGSAKIVSL